jgi:hypothetical protein
MIIGNDYRSKTIFSLMLSDFEVRVTKYTPGGSILPFSSHKLQDTLVNPVSSKTHFRQTCPYKL